MQGVFTKILNLWIPNKTDKGTVVTDVFEPNFTKLDQYAEATNQTLEDLKNNKLDKGTYSGKASDLKSEIDGKVSKSGGIITGPIDVQGTHNANSYYSSGTIVSAGAITSSNLNVSNDNNPHVAFRTATGTIKGYVGNIEYSVRLYNSTCNKFIALEDDGVGIYPSTSLKTEAKDLSGAVNELLDNKLDKGTYLGNASDLNKKIDDNTVKILGSLGKNDGFFPLSSATKNNVYYLPSNDKFYICITDYSGGLISVPNANFEELSIYTNRLIINGIKEYETDVSTFGGSGNPNFISLVFTRIGNKVFVNGMIYPDSNAEYGYANLIPANFRPSENKTLYYWTLDTGTATASSGSALFYPDGTILLKNPILSRNKQALLTGFYIL